MDFLIRLAEEQDAEGLAALNEEFNGAGAHAGMLDFAGGELVAVALTGGRQVAFACVQSYRSFCYDAPQGEITELYVRPANRQQGIASALVAFLEQHLRERGVESVKILTGAGNTAAQRVYTASGYTRKDETVFHKSLADV